MVYLILSLRVTGCIPVSGSNSIKLLISRRIVLIYIIKMPKNAVFKKKQA